MTKVVDAMQRFLVVTATILWLGGLAGLLFMITEKTTASSAAQRTLLDDPPLVGLDTRFINIATLGHRGLFDDVVTIYALQYLVDPELKKHPPEAVQKQLRTITRHHPKLDSLYMLSCFVLALDLDAPQLCEAITLDGLAAVPASWRIPLTQGFIEYNRLGNKPKAAIYYEMAAAKPDAPAYTASLAKKLLDQAGDVSMGDLQETLRLLLTVPDGSKMSSFLEENIGRPQTEPATKGDRSP